MKQYLEIKLPDGRVKTFDVGVLVGLGRQIYLGLAGSGMASSLTMPDAKFKQFGVVAVDNGLVYVRATKEPYGVYRVVPRSVQEPWETSRLESKDTGVALPLFRLDEENPRASFKLSKGTADEDYAFEIGARSEQPSDRLEGILQEYQPFS